jgi:hypothetical protein
MPIGNEQHLTASQVNNQLAALIERWDKLAADSARYAEKIKQLGAEGLQAAPLGFAEQDAVDHLDVADRIYTAVAAWDNAGAATVMIRARGLNSS